MHLFSNVKLDVVDNIKFVDSIKSKGSFKALCELMDCNDVKYTPDSNRCASPVGDVKFFLRTYSGNKIVTDKEGNYLFTQELKSAPDGITLNDYVLVCARDLMCRLYSSTDLLLSDVDIRSKIALSSFPVPYGIYYDKQNDVNVALVQLCVDNTQLTGFLSTDYNYVNVENTGLLEFLDKHISDVKFRYTKD